MVENVDCPEMSSSGTFGRVPVNKITTYENKILDNKSKPTHSDLRTFAPIATAHFFAHVTHSSCIADHEGNKHGIEAQTFSRRIERKSMWHHGIVVDPGLLGNVTQLVTV